MRTFVPIAQSPATGDLFMQSRAQISKCGLYRYSLTREWGDGPKLPVVMLNPSTADATKNDPTIRRLAGPGGFALREGYAGLIVANLFAFRATDPESMANASDPIGPQNDDVLEGMAVQAALSGVPVLCAWGAHWMAPPRAYVVTSLMREAGARLVCLGLTKSGAPRHPLYVEGGAPFLPFGGGA